MKDHVVQSGGEKMGILLVKQWPLLPLLQH